MNNTSSGVKFGTFKRNILSERIAERLLVLIKDKQLKPGDRLPPERELSAIMNVSRPSLRDALRALSIMGIINHIQGSGNYVSSLKPARLIEHLDFIFSLDNSTLLELIEARDIIEVSSAALAAERISDEEIKNLERLIVQSENCYTDPQRFLECDLEIHLCITNAAHNNIISIFMTAINKLNIYSRTQTGEVPKVRKHSINAHKKILQAIKDRDSEAARSAMREHLDYIMHRLVDLSGHVSVDDKN